MTKHIDLTGSTFHSWTVVGYSHSDHHKKRFWTCTCSCGAQQHICTNNLLTGKTRMCRKCSSKIVADKFFKTHGKSKTRLYKTWQNIKTKCRAGECGLDIKVCAEWMTDFGAFESYVVSAIGPPPNRLFTLGRVNHAKDYEQGNLRWSTTYAEMVGVRKAMTERLKILNHADVAAPAGAGESPAFWRKSTKLARAIPPLCAAIIFGATGLHVEANDNLSRPSLVFKNRGTVYQIDNRFLAVTESRRVRNPDVSAHCGLFDFHPAQLRVRQFVSLSNFKSGRWANRSVVFNRLGFSPSTKRRLKDQLNRMGRGTAKILEHYVEGDLTAGCVSASDHKMGAGEIYVRSEFLLSDTLHVTNGAVGRPSGSNRTPSSNNGPNGGGYGGDGLSNIPTELRICRCYDFFRSLRRAPLLAQISFFAVLGAGASCLVCISGLVLLRSERGWFPKSLLSLIAGLSLFVFAAWASIQRGACHHYSHCYGREQRAPYD